MPRLDGGLEAGINRSVRRKEGTMAKKSTGTRRGTSAGARSTKSAKRGSKPAARSRAAGASKAAGRGRTAAKGDTTRVAKTSGRAKPASKRAAGARAKAAATTLKRAFKDRQQPETLRLKNHSVALTADDVEASLKFYVDGFGFHVKQRWEENGKLLGLEARRRVVPDRAVAGRLGEGAQSHQGRRAQHLRGEHARRRQAGGAAAGARRRLRGADGHAVGVAAGERQGP